MLGNFLRTASFDQLESLIRMLEGVNDPDYYVLIHKLKLLLKK